MSKLKKIICNDNYFLNADFFSILFKVIYFNYQSFFKFTKKK